MDPPPRANLRATDPRPCTQQLPETAFLRRQDSGCRSTSGAGLGVALLGSAAGRRSSARHPTRRCGRKTSRPKPHTGRAGEVEGCQPLGLREGRSAEPEEPSRPGYQASRAPASTPSMLGAVQGAARRLCPSAGSRSLASLKSRPQPHCLGPRLSGVPVRARPALS